MTKPPTAAQQMYQALSLCAAELAKINVRNPGAAEAYLAGCKAMGAYEAHLKTYAGRMEAVRQARRDKHTRRPCTCGAPDELHHKKKCPAYWSMPARRARIAALEGQGT